MSSVRLEKIKTLKVNITQSMHVSANEQIFVTVNRYRSSNSSMFDYQIEVYNLTDFNLLKQKYIYSSYQPQKNPCVILPDLKTIVVATLQKIIFFDQTLNIKYEQIHNQRDIWDLQVSPDSKLVVFVGGQSVALWDPLTFKRIDYGKISQTTKLCRFSKDSQYMGISTENTLYLYQILPIGYTFQFKLIRDIKYARQQNQDYVGIINSFDFNPINNRQIAIAFGNASPRLYNIDTNLFTRISSDQQPSHIDNAKFVKFMPDGKRIFSTDTKGMGLWPGDANKRLVYLEGHLLHSMRPIAGGKRVIGYNWQNILVFQIQAQCKKSTFAPTCPCQSQFYWDLRTQSCQSCIQGVKNICLCGANQNFISDLGRCVYNCPSVTNSIKSTYNRESKTTPCFCMRGYTWKNGQCIFDCGSILMSIGVGNQPETCLCQAKFVWNNILKQCVCQKNYQLVMLKDRRTLDCECVEGYEVNNTNGECQPKCGYDPNSLSQRDQFNNCKCKQGYIFKVYQNITLVRQGNKQIKNQQNQQSFNYIYFESTQGACVRNCSMLKYSIGRINEDNDYDSCVCRENAVWVRGKDGNRTNDQCQLGCKSIKNGVQLRRYENGTQYCTCSLNYHWVPEISQCGRSCDAVPFVDKTKFTSTQSCPCVDKFYWDYDNLKSCKIDCNKVNYSQTYNPKSPHSCLCRNLFNWDQKSLECVIDCSLIWDAGNRTKIDQCSCNNKKTFNKKKNICELNSVENVFSRPWIWAIIALAVLFLVIVVAVMLKFCWKFKQKKNKQNQKRLKKNTQPKVKKRKQKQNQYAKTNTLSSQRVELKKF